MRFELTVRNLDKVPELGKLLNQYDLKKLNLTDKTGMPNNLEAAKIFQIGDPTLDIVPHYSFKNHTNRFPEQIIANFEDFLVQSEALGLKEVMLMSGNPKPKFEVLQSVELIKSLEKKPALTYACTYNPYFEGEQLDLENLRLKAKMDSQFFSSVYIQIGIFTEKLKTGLDYLKGLNPDIKIFGCLLLPNEQLLKNFAFRPWHGVFLDPEYLGSLEIARFKTREIFGVYNQYQVEPLVELPSLKEENMAFFNEFFGS